MANYKVNTLVTEHTADFLSGESADTVSIPQGFHQIKAKKIFGNGGWTYILMDDDDARKLSSLETACSVAPPKVWISFYESYNATPYGNALLCVYLEESTAGQLTNAAKVITSEDSLPSGAVEYTIKEQIGICR